MVAAFAFVDARADEDRGGLIGFGEREETASDEDFAPVVLGEVVHAVQTRWDRRRG
jgi:hypothetical protein